MLAMRPLTISILVAWCAALSKEFQHQIIVEDESAASLAVRDILVDNEIIADVLDDFEPTYALDLAYPKYHESVALGNDIPVTSVAKRPTVSFHLFAASKRDDADSTFTLILTDPDALSRTDPSKSEMCHWILTNLTLPALSKDVPVHNAWVGKSGNELEEYQPPGPPNGTGRHRYVFVLLKGDSGTTPKAPAARPHWGYDKVRHGVRDWAQEYNLKVVGANFFFAQHKRQ